MPSVDNAIAGLAKAPLSIKNKRKVQTPNNLDTDLRV